MKHLILLISFTILGAPIASAGTNSAVLDTGTDEDKRFKDRYSIEGQFDTAAEASVDLHACTACGSKTDLRSSLGKIVGTSAVATSIESGVKGQRVPYYEASKLQPIPNEADLDEAQANQVLIYSLRHQQPVGNGTRILTEDTILAPKHVVYDSETMERIARVSEILVCFGDDFRGVKFQLSQGNLSNCYSVKGFARFGSETVYHQHEDAVIVKLNEPVRLDVPPAGFVVAGERPVTEVKSMVSIGFDEELSGGLLKGVQVCNRHPMGSGNVNRHYTRYRQLDCVGYPGFSGGMQVDLNPDGTLQRDRSGRIVLYSMLVAAAGKSGDDIFILDKNYRKGLAIDRELGQFIYDWSQRHY